ncbi:response regulator [Pseudobutyrivibrio xylanivorans]|uniref:Stage 0 sporulation protein A homolog n=1 Tax=Pseudobutyrivibrio xylanivorans TaxID=185007 RepID=A0A5P6VTX2_PSEXY|nr:response regulator [Pseudobutyrivibrio xylanivorans]QFJ55768.1 response regulator [Pseudobutyrivibrio xylanivorans]
MSEKLLIISHGSTFMVDAIEKNLRQVGFETFVCDPMDKDFKDKVDNYNIYLIYLGDYIMDVAESFVYLKDTCIEQEKSLNVIGDSMEMQEFHKVIPEGVIENVFSRPLDIKKMTTVMEEVGLQSDSNAKKKSILLVDDDATFLRTVKEWLSDKYKVTIVSSGMQAITYIAKNIPDLILLDYEMPVTNGPQVLEMIRSENTTADIPVIFLTGKDDKESVTKVLALKPQGYILKSAGRQKLVGQIEEFFAIKKAAQ